MIRTGVEIFPGDFYMLFHFIPLLIRLTLITYFTERNSKISTLLFPNVSYKKLMEAN